MYKKKGVSRLPNRFRMLLNPSWNIQRQSLRREILTHADYDALLLRNRPYISGPVVITPRIHSYPFHNIKNVIAPWAYFLLGAICCQSLAPANIQTSFLYIGRQSFASKKKTQ